MKKVDFKTWKRSEHFAFFSSFEDPSFGISTAVSCTRAYSYCKEERHSFFAYYLHRSLQAANQTEEFRYRIHQNDVVVFDEIHAGPTLARDDGTFGFSFIPYNDNFTIFSQALQEEIDNVQHTTGIRKSIDGERINVIYYSTLPWINFTGLKHPFTYTETAGIPKITFGKIYHQNGEVLLPISIQAHHGLVDGLHIATYLENFQTLLNEQ